MVDPKSPQPAREPEDLSRYIVERINAGDLEGLVALYEPDAVLEFPPGNMAIGEDAIRQAFAGFLASKPTATPGDVQPAMVAGDLALTSTRFGNSATVEVARRQPDGSWRWVIDKPNILG